MKNEKLFELRVKLGALAVFRDLLSDTVLSSLLDYMDAAEGDIKNAASAYARFVHALYSANGGNLSLHIKELCENSENIYVKAVGKGIDPGEHIKKSLKGELALLQEISELSPKELCLPIMSAGYLPEYIYGGVDIKESFMHRAENIGKYGYGIYAKHKMFYIGAAGDIIPVKNPDGTRLCDLVDYEAERNQILDNTKALLCGKPASNILLTGDAGTGKSSSIKAVVNELSCEGLRIIEVRKDQLGMIPAVLDELAENPLKFILFIDDLSFLKDDDNFNALKAVLEGSVSARSKNTAIYATSNRRHIIKEKFSDREGDDIHRNETVQELISLSERFGMHISFSKPNKATYLHIVNELAKQKGISMAQEELELLAERFALERGGRSPRLANQLTDKLVADCK